MDFSSLELEFKENSEMDETGTYDDTSHILNDNPIQQNDENATEINGELESPHSKNSFEVDGTDPDSTVRFSGNRVTIPDNGSVSVLSYKTVKAFHTYSWALEICLSSLIHSEERERERERERKDVFCCINSLGHLVRKMKCTLFCNKHM